jgi:hypothetical protein
MSDHRISPAADLSPETVRQYLAVNAQRELDALHAKLDVRLSALEAALAHPDPRTSLEDRPRSGRASPPRKPNRHRTCVSRAQLRAWNAQPSPHQMQVARAKTRSPTLRLDLEQARTALDAEREGAEGLRQNSFVRKALEEAAWPGSIGHARSLAGRCRGWRAPRRQVTELEQALNTSEQRRARLRFRAAAKRRSADVPGAAAGQRERAAIQTALTRTRPMPSPTVRRSTP